MPEPSEDDLKAAKEEGVESMRYAHLDQIRETATQYYEIGRAEGRRGAEQEVKDMAAHAADLNAQCLEAEARLREVEEQQSCHDCKEYREMMTARLREAKRERDEERSRLDIGSGVKIALLTERAEAAEAHVRALQDALDHKREELTQAIAKIVEEQAETMRAVQRGIKVREELREYRAALDALYAACHDGIDNTADFARLKPALVSVEALLARHEGQ